MLTASAVTRSIVLISPICAAGLFKLLCWLDPAWGMIIRIAVAVLPLHRLLCSGFTQRDHRLGISLPSTALGLATIVAQLLTCPKARGVRQGGPPIRDGERSPPWTAHRPSSAPWRWPPRQPSSPQRRPEPAPAS